MIKESDPLFHEIASNFQDGLWATDHEDRLIFFNASMERISGVTADQVLGLDVMSDFREETVRYFIQYYDRAKESLQPVEYEAEIMTPAGRTTIQCGWCIPRILDGQYNGMICSIRDVTELKKGEKTIFEKTALLEALLNSSIDGVLIVNPEGRRVLQNRRTIELWKIPGHIADDPDDLLQLEYVMQMTVNPEAFLKQLNFLNDHPEESTQDEVHLKDGTILERYSAPVLGKDGQYFGRIWCFHDITSRKKAEIALSESETLFRTIFDLAGDGMFVVDYEKSCFLLANRQCLKLLGYTLQEFVQLELKDLHFPEDLSVIQEEMSKCSKLNETRQGEVGFKRKDGSILFTELKSVGAVIESRVCLLVTFRDISERKATEQIIQNTQKLEALGILAGGIAHDFNNLLCGIFGYIGLAKELTSAPSVSGYLVKALNTIDRARSLTQQLLTFSKGGSPMRKIEPLFPFVEEAVRFSMSGSNVSCSFFIQEGLWLCNYDRNQIGQAIDNVVINALQAMPGGGTIEIHGNNVTLEENEHPVMKKGEYVRLSIRDQGAGIPEEYVSRIFDPFFTTKKNGHGLGLATTYSIIKRHGGYIEVDSKQEKGTVVHLFIPASGENGLTGPGGVTEEEEHHGRGVFLVIDDEEVVRDTFSSMLGSFGYEVIALKNGRDAIDLLGKGFGESKEFAGIIFDLTIPGGMGGREAVSEIRRLAVEVPFFVTSGYESDPIMVNPSGYGFSGCIRKPFSKAELVKILNRSIKQKCL